MSESYHSGLPPRSPGRIILDLIKDLGLTQTELAAQLGVSKQYINAVVRDREILSEEKFRKIIATSSHGRELMDEARSYYEWIKTPGGRNYQLQLRQPEVLEAFTIRGARILTPKEIRDACNVKLFSIARCEEEESDPRDLIIGVASPFGITCHLKNVTSHDMSQDSINTLMEIPAKSSITIQTQETFSLGNMASLQFNGVVIHLRENGIRCCCDHYIQFPKQESLFLTLDNISSRPFTLYAGMPLITANIYFNPFSSHDADNSQDRDPSNVASSVVLRG